MNPSMGSSSVLRNKSPYYKKKALGREDSGVTPASGRSQRDAAQAKLLAAVGLDLFRTGLAVDNTKPIQKESRHPAVAPNLLSIPEGEQVVPSLKSMPMTQAIVIIDGPVSGNLPGVWLGQRIDAAFSLYQTIVEQHNSLCYVFPLGGDDSDQSLIEAETARNHLVHRGVSPHHIVMDCNSANTIDNIVSLVRCLRHLRISIVRVVSSLYHMPRLQQYFGRLLGACHDMKFQIFYHPTAHDHLSRQQQADKEAAEQAVVIRSRQYLEDAVRLVSLQFAQHTLPPPGPARAFYT
ncbi:hypothetical protein AeMF1_003254 [Aphanomyces euteiches]|nr:hypothetical protein Ae201684P_014274 [Aphanomyces euteiches]KAH9126301.1 hypothetical protein AeMF1_003254 [Aphanomyces euteiches]KAH9193421.1 hypothetical protein AeNC1_004595 [Aphanomyces euteiches]